MLSAKQGGIKYYFLSLWYDSTKEWTLVLRDIYIYIYIHAPPWGLSILAKEFMAAACIMQSSSNELRTLVSGKV